MLEPLNTWLVIKPLATDDKVGSLFIPGNSSAAYKRGVVIAPPAAGEDIPMLKIGDVVLYDSLGEVSFRSGNDMVYMVKARELMGIIRGSAE